MFVNAEIFFVLFGDFVLFCGDMFFATKTPRHKVSRNQFNPNSLSFFTNSYCLI
jgi:hypothetical protein